MWRQRSSSIFYLIYAALMSSACAPSPHESTVPQGDIAQRDHQPADMTSRLSMTASLEGLDALDKALYSAYKPQIEEIAAKSLPRDNSGLIGRNAQWGAMYSPRFQLGVGGALRIALLSGDQDAISRAFLGAQVAFKDMEPSGRLPSSVPDEIAQGQSPSRADIASGAAFFMGDVCLGLWRLERDQARGAQWVEATQLDELKRRTARVMDWLNVERPQLEQADARAPNRLLFDARTFIACGGWLERDDDLQTGLDFIDKAQALQRDDGVFVEGGGHDTSYQSVATRLAHELGALLGPSAHPIQTSAARGAQWLISRVCEDGRVDSSQNTRTCGGGEAFLGTPKLLSVEDVFLSLAVYGLTEQAAASGAERLITWSKSSPETSCFESCEP